MSKPTPPHAAQPARHHINVLGQILKFIPRHIIQQSAKETGVDLKARSYSVLSHLGTMLFVQLAHALSLNDVCDWLRLKARAIAAFGITPPSRNNLSNANKGRDAKFAQQVFWRTLAHLQHCDASFGRQRPGGGARSLLHRFKVRIHAVDSTVMELVANCMDWAKHRRRKAAAKLHLRLGLHSFLPAFAIIDTAGEHDSKRAREVCAGLQEGEIVVFDKAYVDFGHLHDLDSRGVQWVTRAKDNLCYRSVRNLPVKQQGSKVVKDQIVKLTGVKWRKFKGWTLRRVEAWVEVEGKERLMVFITNNTAWSPRSVCDLYRARWDIEVFFKQVKQTLKLGGFLGHSANAIRWQVWTALLVYVLLRYAAHLTRWGHSFTRLFAVVRSAMWERLDLAGLLRSYGTAGGSFTLLGAPHAAWLPGFEPPGPPSHGTALA